MPPTEPIVIDWRHKGFGPALEGMSADELARRRPGLFDGDFTSPVAVLRADALDHNVAVLARYCAEHGVAFAPHGKTPLAPELAKRQLAAGAWGITAASVREVRVHHAHGIRRFFIANQVVDPAEIRWLADQLRSDPEFVVSVYADSTAGVRLLAEALADAPTTPPLPVVVELGVRGARTGARDRATALEVARAIASEPALCLRGVSGYEAVVGDHDAPGTADGVAAFLHELGSTLSECRAEGLVDTSHPALLSAGGSVHFPSAARVLRSGWGDKDVTVLIRSGAYVAHDDGVYEASSPLATRRGGSDTLRPALELWSRIVSVPEPGLAVADFGKRDTSTDAGPPVPRELRRGAASRVIEPGTVTVEQLNDQHARLRLSGADVAVGDWLRCGISHPCTTFDRWRLLPVVEGDVVVGCVRTYF